MLVSTERRGKVFGCRGMGWRDSEEGGTFLPGPLLKMHCHWGLKILQ